MINQHNGKPFDQRELQIEASRVRGQIASKEKASMHGEIKTAKIADATLPSLRRRLADIEAAIPSAPPAPTFLSFAAATPVAFNRTTYPTDAELSALEIPDFLKRQ